MIEKDDILIGILANGTSSRMGQDKALMPFCDGSLLSFQLEKYCEMGFEHIAVNHYMHLDDEVKDCGPLSGIHTLMKEAERLNKQFLIIVPVDMPFLSEQCLKQLLSKQLNANIRHFDAQILPLIIHVNNELIQKLKIFISTSNNYAIRAFFEQIETQSIEHEFDDQIFMNLNNAKDVLLAEKLLDEKQT